MRCRPRLARVARGVRRYRCADAAGGSRLAFDPLMTTAAPDVDAARRVLRTEIAGLEALLADLDGSVTVTGMGKSGHIARKIAATLSSTGTPAQFVHPAEASHGDLGMLAEGDA